MTTALRADRAALIRRGLWLNYLTIGWWWADPVAALGMAPIIVKEGLEGGSGRSRLRLPSLKSVATKT